MQNDVTLVRGIYREYLEWAKSLLVLAETCSIKEWPDRKQVLQNVFRLQVLYNERESIRFEFLIGSNTPDIGTWKSLSRINERLLKEWSAVEEASLKQGNSTYRNVLRGIEDLEGKTDSPALDEPFQALTRNTSYRDARQSFAKRIKLLNEKLSL
jgi:hypothetical protein